jgi:hypothetical protein
VCFLHLLLDDLFFFLLKRKGECFMYDSVTLGLSLCLRAPGCAILEGTHVCDQIGYLCFIYIYVFIFSILIYHL